ncbi:uncharacterized protein UV8b_02683 [Ustilaginoidea virens]|uniref:Uncharacterized protein n=1 Tax=Ustilaginoidea virens TaxID=1159556 RepID=A0A8E5MGC7_USTVR|nr:uncharacterized protein UV8b_02683 [Ustilaginoidea virens]QUC18442.1 hypothetical protein UV8b_02683 [Ustilaginoidea virens]
MKLRSLLAAGLASWPVYLAVAAPIGPTGPCPHSKVDAILKGDLDPSACCSYGKCLKDVVISVGD